LAGHLIEICEGSGVRANIEFEQLPLLPHVSKYLELGCSPGGTDRNLASAGNQLGAATEMQQKILCDPQTSGGLLVVVTPEEESNLLSLARHEGYSLRAFGYLTAASGEQLISVL
jgi:selenide,water dikinase